MPVISAFIKLSVTNCLVLYAGSMASGSGDYADRVAEIATCKKARKSRKQPAAASAEMASASALPLARNIPWLGPDLTLLGMRQLQVILMSS